MSARTLVILFIGLLCAFGLWAYWRAEQAEHTTIQPQALVFDQNVSDGTLTLSVPSKEFGLAVTPEQVLVHAYIPPCTSGFTYCLYYQSEQYEGTNFESAGLSLTKRPDLSAERLCLDTPPQGYDATKEPAASTSTSAYSASVFSPIRNAAAGHYADGSVYRLWMRKTNACYDIETRIGETQFANYPEGVIRPFTTADRAALQGTLDVLLRHITIASSSVPVRFPELQ